MTILKQKKIWQYSNSLKIIYKRIKFELESNKNII